MSKNILIGILVIAVIVLGIFLFKKEKPEVIKVPVTIEVPVPGIIGTFPPVTLPKPKEVKPRPDLVDEYNDSEDKIKDSLYADAVKERFYEEICKDTVQSVTVKSTVQGKLLKQQVDYEIFPRTIDYDTVIEVPIPKRIELYGLLETGTSIEQIKPVGKATFLLKNKRDKILSIGIDTQKSVYLGYGFKF